MAPRTPGTKRNTTNKARGGNTKTSARGGGSLQSLTLPQLRQWHKSFMQTEKLVGGLQAQQEIQKPILQAMAKIHNQTFDFTSQTNTTARGGGNKTNARSNRTRAVTGRGRAQNNNQQSATG